MKAVVLAGGYATRHRPISYVLPKLLFPVLEKPMIYWTLDLLNDVGVDEVILGVNYMADTLRARVGSSYRGMSVKYSLEAQELGTAGPMKLASMNTEIKEAFFAMNGDVIADISLEAMLKQHQETKAVVTDALHEVEDPSRFGVVELGQGKQIRRFVEKPKPGAAPSRLVNAGIYIIDPEVLQQIDQNRKVSLEREIFPTLAKQEKLYGFQFSGHWFDIGSLSDYQKANFSLLTESSRKPKTLGENVNIADDSVIQTPVSLGDNSTVASQARVGPKLLLGSNGSIGRQAKVKDSILFERVSIGENSEVNGAIIGSGVTVGNSVRIGDGCVISPNVVIADRVKVGDGAIIHPYKEIDRDIGSAEHVM